MSGYKTLFIVRHGKSSWDFADIDDIDRPLLERGISNAYEMSNRLKIKNLIPDCIVSSPANRALHTANIFARELEVPYNNFYINKNLYFDYEEKILDFIKNTDDKVGSLMIFGHNPTFTNFANKFVKNCIDNIPTAGIVILQFSCERWKEISKDNLKAEFFDFPKKNS